MTRTVAHKFTFTFDNHTQREFLPGEVLPKELENNDYAASFSTNPPKVRPKPGTPEAALEDYKRKQRAAMRDAAAADAAEAAAQEAAQKAEVDRLQAVVKAAYDATAATATGVGQIGEETAEQRAAAQVRVMHYQMPQDRDEAAAATRPVVAADPTPTPITTKPQYVPLTDASLDKARAEATQAAKRKRA